MVGVGVRVLLAAIECSFASTAKVGEIGADNVGRFLASPVDGEERGINFVTAGCTALSSGLSEEIDSSGFFKAIAAPVFHAFLRQVRQRVSRRTCRSETE